MINFSDSSMDFHGLVLCNLQEYNYGAMDMLVRRHPNFGTNGGKN
jgi:hypothetical protein